MHYATLSCLFQCQNNPVAAVWQFIQKASPCCLHSYKIVLSAMEMPQGNQGTSLCNLGVEECRLTLTKGSTYNYIVSMHVDSLFYHLISSFHESNNISFFFRRNLEAVHIKLHQAGMLLHCTIPDNLTVPHTI